MVMKKSSKSIKLDKMCCDDAGMNCCSGDKMCHHCTEHSLPKCAAMGCAFGGAYLLSVLVAWLAPGFHNYLWNVMFHGSLTVIPGDFSVATVIAGLVAWFIVGFVLKFLFFHGKKWWGCE